MEKREDKILKIISIEWDMFQDVNNIGGRASCQDDYETFEIMRRSQYENWTEEMLDIYLNWASISRKAGRNLVAEKYGRMMQHTDPLYYKEKIEPELPALSERQRELIDEITGVLVAWEDEFGRNYRNFPERAGRFTKKMIRAVLHRWKHITGANWQRIPWNF